MIWELAELPFFEERHRQLAERVSAWCDSHCIRLQAGDRGDLAAHSRDILRSLAEAGFLDFVLPEPHADSPPKFDLRSICIIRERLAYESNFVASLFIVQGMGLSPLLRLGGGALRDAYIGRSRRGETIAAVAISELQGGSDVAAIATTIRPDGDAFVLNGEKAWIANGGIANHFLVLAQSPDSARKPAISALLVDADLPGVIVHPDTQMIDNCPLTMVGFENVRVPATHLLGAPGDGFRAVMAGFDIFRPSVGAAAVGVAKRALSEAVSRVNQRKLFGKRMAELDGVQSSLAEMLVDIETGSLAVYRAAWLGDVTSGRFSTEAAIAKLAATEAAQRVVDNAVQLFGALGVSNGSIVERLYREVRPMRIYEGTSEIQKKIIARAILNPGKTL